MRGDPQSVFDPEVQNRLTPSPHKSPPPPRSPRASWELKGGAETYSAGRRPKGSGGGYAPGARGAGLIALPTRTTLWASARPCRSRADIIARARGCPGEGDWRKRFLGLAGGGAPLPLGRSTEVEVVAGLSPCELREGILNLAEGERYL